MKKQNKLLAFLLVFALLFSLMGNVALATEPEEQILQTQKNSSPTDITTPTNLYPTEGTELDNQHVYITIQTGDGVAKGRSGEPILTYPVIFKNGMTAENLVRAIHDYEFHEYLGGKGSNVKVDTNGAFTWIWGKEVSPTYLFRSNNDFITASTTVEAGESYYLNINNNTSTSFVYPYKCRIEPLKNYRFDASFYSEGSYLPFRGNGVKVYYSKSFEGKNLTEVTTFDNEGWPIVNIPKEGRYYVYFTKNGVANAVCPVIVQKVEDPNDIDHFTKSDENELVTDDLYLIVTKSGNKSYAFSYNPSDPRANSNGFFAEELSDINANTATCTSNYSKWFSRSGNTVQTYEKFKDRNDNDVYEYVYAGSQGLMVFTTGRTFVYKNGKIFLHDGMYCLSFDGTNFTQIPASDAAKASTFELYSIDFPGNFSEPTFIPDGSPYKPIVRDAVTNSDGTVSLAFASDIHHSTDYDHMNLEVWLNNVFNNNEDVDYFDAMGFCGDMGSAYSSTAEIYWKNVEAVIDYMDTEDCRLGLNDSKENGKIGNVIYTFGNHEWYPQAGGNFMINYGTKEYNHKTGQYGTNPVIDRFVRVGKAMETDKYIIYCLGPGSVASKLSSGYSDEDVDSLRVFLDNLTSQQKAKPIFILVHFPLHLWGDRLAGNASAVVEALNGHTDENIYVLWGHNHSDFDENYDAICRPGDKIEISEDKFVNIDFTYLSAGCDSDEEYSGADGGSAWVQGKGVVATINTNGTVDFTYYTMDGKPMTEKGDYLVVYRENVSYSTIVNDTFPGYEYVDRNTGKANPPAAPAIVNYAFKRWTVSKDSKNVTFDPSKDKIDRHTLVTGEYEYSSGLDKDYVYMTILDETGNVVKGKNNDILMYKVPYKSKMTVLDVLKEIHKAEYPLSESESIDGVLANIRAESKHNGGVSWLWGYAPDNGSMVFGAGEASKYIKATAAVTPGESYYVTLYNYLTTEDKTKDYLATSYLAPYETNVYVNNSVDFITKYWQFNTSNYKYYENDFNGKVYIGTSLENLEETDINVANGAFSYTFDKVGTYYVVVIDEDDNKDVTNAYCIVNVRQRVRPNTDDTTGGGSGGGGGGGSSSGSGDTNNPPTDTTPAASEAVKPEAKADASGVAKAAVETKAVSEAVASAKESGADSIVIAPEVSGDAKEVKVEMPKTAVNEIASGTEASLVVETDTAALEVPNDALEAINEQAGANVEISVAEKSVEDAGVKEAIADKFGADVNTENAAVAEITVSSDNKNITSFGGKTINAKVSVEGKPGFVEGRKYLALVISANGKREIFAGKCARGANGKLNVGVKVGHLSTFVILDKELKSFADAEAHWAADAVDYAVANELMNGVSDSAFAPNSTLNRAMLVTVLYRLAGSPAAAEAAKFADVAAGQWYTEAVAWAAANGIVTGKTETTFAPMENITREQFATMLMRYCKFAGIDTSAAGNLGAFADSATISAYAQDALAWANAAGIITGRTATTIAPTGNATRGEAATMLMRFLQM